MPRDNVWISNLFIGEALRKFDTAYSESFLPSNLCIQGKIFFSVLFVYTRNSVITSRCCDDLYVGLKEYIKHNC